MWIRKIHLEEGFFTRDIDFSDHVNLIYSHKNSVGKTTLLRLILYGMGYEIPGTRQLKFSNCKVRLILELDGGEIIELQRYQKEWIKVIIADQTQVYTLPEQQYDLHNVLFCTKNTDILENILGTFYIDQEKGWTLLNRGKVIGNIHFSIDELIRGLADKDCSELLRKREKLEMEVDKYKTLVDIAEYRNALQKEQENFLEEPYDEKIEITLATLETEKTHLERELKRVDYVLKNNQEVADFISKMHLMIKTPDKEIVPVTIDNVVNLNDSLNLMITKQKFLTDQLNSIQKKIKQILSQKDMAQLGEALFQSESKIETLDRRISYLPIDLVMLKTKLDQTKKSLKATKFAIDESTRVSNQYSIEMTKFIRHYAQELGLDVSQITRNYLFTSKLKELTGAILHKITFTFKLAYIKVLQEKLNIVLPIIMDSPRGREIDEANTEAMMRILKNEFNENQIIIASIYKYSTFKDDCHVIELRDKLIEDHVNGVI